MNLLHSSVDEPTVTYELLGTSKAWNPCAPFANGFPMGDSRGSVCQCDVAKTPKLMQIDCYLYLVGALAPGIIGVGHALMALRGE